MTLHSLLPSGYHSGITGISFLSHSTSFGGLAPPLTENLDPPLLVKTLKSFQNFGCLAQQIDNSGGHKKKAYFGLM